MRRGGVASSEAMARIEFTPQLRRFVDTPEVDSAAADLRGALDEVFAAHPQLRGYVLDDQDHLRANVVVFIDGRRVLDRVRLDDPLAPDSRVYVLQALSGG
jgi:sulfur-carrier protein